MDEVTRSARFWAKVDKAGQLPEHRPELGPCWLWTGAGSDGYGRFSVGGGRTMPAHRFAYLVLVGPLPAGLEPDHLCRVHGCVKVVGDEHGPAHLEMVTHSENLRRGLATRTHCPQGHPYDEANTGVYGGSRHCRMCARDRERRKREAMRARNG